MTISSKNSTVSAGVEVENLVVDRTCKKKYVRNQACWCIRTDRTKEGRKVVREERSEEKREGGREDKRERGREDKREDGRKKDLWGWLPVEQVTHTLLVS